MLLLFLLLYLLNVKSPHCPIRIVPKHFFAGVKLRFSSLFMNIQDGIEMEECINFFFVTLRQRRRSFLFYLMMMISKVLSCKKAQKQRQFSLFLFFVFFLLKR